MEFRRVLFRSVERRDLIAPRQCPWPLPARQPYRRFRGNAVRKQEMHAFSPEIDGNAIKALQHSNAQEQRQFVVQMELTKRAHVGKDNRQIGDADTADRDLSDKYAAYQDHADWSHGRATGRERNWQ